MHNLLLIKRYDRSKKTAPSRYIPSSSISADELSELSKLKEKGILTKGEFL